MSTVDKPKSLANEAERKARTEALRQQHMIPLTQFVHRLRALTGHDAGVPDFDPLDGGINAECLFLLEAPGGRAKGSGFVSRNNPDETAKNFFLINQEAGLSRRYTITWNIVPWYVGSNTKIRAVTKADIRSAEPYLRELLDMLPLLRVIVLVGRKAQLAKPLIAQLAPHCVLLECPHPSPLSLNGRPQRRLDILSCMEDAADRLGSLTKATAAYQQ